LFQANRWDWQPHRKLGTKYLVVLCAGSALLLAEDESTSIVKRRPCWSAIKPVRITFSRHCLLFSWTINLGFLTEEKSAAILIILSSWGSQRAGHSPRTRTSDLPHQLGVSIASSKNVNNGGKTWAQEVGGQWGRSPEIQPLQPKFLQGQNFWWLAPEVLPNQNFSFTSGLLPLLRSLNTKSKNTISETGLEQGR
jgi:hypothetical protein